MAILQLSEEQIRTMSVEEKDRWWLENVYRGDMPQLTWRSGLSGMVIGGALSLTNLYVGMKTGWTLGVGITSVILAFAMFKFIHTTFRTSEFTILENNAMQSIATAAGYMTGPLISSMAAYMMITNKVIPMSTTFVWVTAISVLGVLFAFPLKRRFINDEQHPFPEGRAAGIVMDALHTSDAGSGLFKAKILAGFGIISALFKFFVEGGEILKHFKLERLTLPGALEAPILSRLGLAPRILGTKLEELTVSIEPDNVMFAAGGLSGIRTGISLLIGALINYCILAPWAIQHGDVFGAVGADGDLIFGFRRVTIWALWGGVAMMTTASLLAFFSKPAMLIGAFSGVLGGKKGGPDCLKHIELPMGVFLVGIPLVGAVVVYLANHFFEVAVWQAIVAIPLVLIFTLIAAHSTALTSITPIGALAKLTQVTFAAIAPRNIGTNIVSASITGEVTSNASNLLMDIKPGYMLGAKPRQQAVGHVLGIIAGSLAAVPVFYALFLKDDPQGLVTEQYSMPSAIVWKAVAELLTRGISELPQSALVAAIVGAMAGIAIEVAQIRMKGRLPVSAVGIGLAFVISFQTCFAMFAGAFFFWLLGKLLKHPESLPHKLFVENMEPICGGIIAGGALMGIAIKVVETFFLGS
ncbi:MAG: OPT/YSL family transporter [Phycisphaerales bacterium]|nr:OPT/YSL family transporter [Phycisphaerales bacterium]